LTLNISETVRDTDIVTMEYYRNLHTRYLRVTLSDLAKYSMTRGIA